MLSLSIFLDSKTRIYVCLKLHICMFRYAWHYVFMWAQGIGPCLQSCFRQHYVVCHCIFMSGKLSCETRRIQGFASPIPLGGLGLYRLANITFVYMFQGSKLSFLSIYRHSFTEWAIISTLVMSIFWFYCNHESKVSEAMFWNFSDLDFFQISIFLKITFFPVFIHSFLIMAKL